MVFSVAKITEERTETIFSINTKSSLSHSSLLPSTLSFALSKLKLKSTDIELIVAGRGPGSFTGLRTGLAFAKGLSLGAETPAAGVSTLSAMAADNTLSPSLAVPVIDARHGELFAAIYEIKVKPGRPWTFKPPIPLTNILLLKPEDFYAKIKEITQELEKERTLPESPIKILGTDAVLLGDPPPGFQIDARPVNPTAMGQIGFRIFQAGTLEKNPLLPLYGRSPEIFKTWKPPSRLMN
jgi:tRNA threonylcarbamoyl adenosine modification protein YeaZ